MADLKFNTGKLAIVQGKLNQGSTTIRACIISGAKPTDPDLATVAAVDAVTNVVVGTERITLTSWTATNDTTDDRTELDAAAFAFAAVAGVTALGLLLYDATTDTSDSTRVPIAFFDTNFGAGIAMDGGLNVTIPTELLYVS